MRLAALLPTMVLIGLVGCSRTYQFEIAVTVTSEGDGSPVEGATIRRNMWGEKSEPKTAETVVQTDSAGRAAERFAVTDAAFSAGKPTWYLRVSKAGYHPEIVEIKPAKAPSEAETRLEVPVKLRPWKE